MPAIRLRDGVESPFELLGIEPGADDDAVEAAYRERVKEAHPDHGGSIREFRAVRAAYEEITAARSGGGPGPGPGSGSGPGTAGDRPESGSGPGPGPGSGRRSGSGIGRRDRGCRSRVEYVDYAALDDHGWSIDDPALFERAADAGLPPEAHGRFSVRAGESVLEAAERHGFAWPFACRGGACANCAIALVEGELSMPVDHILTADLLDRGIRLSCNGVPLTPELKLVFNVKAMPALDELLLPPHPFEAARADD